VFQLVCSLSIEEPPTYPGWKISDGTVNAATVEQIEEKLREQAAFVGLSKGKQARAIHFLSDLGERDNIPWIMPDLVP